MSIITWLNPIGSICSIIGMSVSLIGRSDEVKYQRYKVKGIEMKETLQLERAMRFYKKSLDYAKDNKQQSEIWELVIHIHTDRLIKASEKYRWCNQGYMFEWPWGPHKIPLDYNSPKTK